MLSIIIMIIGGLVAAMNLVASLAPNSKPVFDKLVPVQGIIGLAMIVWSILSLVQLLGHGIFSILAIVIIAVQLVVGFLLSFSLLSQFIFKSADAKEKGEKLRSKLVVFQIPLGLILMAYGVWLLINSFI